MRAAVHKTHYPIKQTFEGHVSRMMIASRRGRRQDDINEQKISHTHAQRAVQCELLRDALVADFHLEEKLTASTQMGRCTTVD